MVGRDDGCVTVAASAAPAAIVRNSSALRAWRGLARPVWAMLVHGDRTAAERLAEACNAALPTADGRWRREPDGGAPLLVAAVAGRRGVRLLSAAEREMEAERIVDAQISRALR